MLKKWALWKYEKMKELTRYVILWDSELILEQGWGLQMPFFYKIGTPNKDP